MQNFKGKHILIIVENLPLPFDRRVWQEANSLRNQGAEISIICPRMKGYTKKYEEINGIKIYRHPLPTEGKRGLGYLAEYSTAIFWEFIISLRIFIKKRFQIIHGCNPPDLIFLTALFFRLFGVKYVFDHHDINPELYIAKFGKKGFLYRIMLLLERLTFATANYSIATNESYKEIAVRRGRMKNDRVAVIRSGPSLERLKITPGNIKYKEGRKYLVGYVGVIGEQEGLDLLLKAVKIIISKTDQVQFAIVGGGTDLEKIKNLSVEMGLGNYVKFYGRVSDKVLIDILNTADVCVNPDKPTEMNNLSTMNKIMEYMAIKKPIVQFDLKEGRFSAQNASLYAENNNTGDFANKILWLLNNEKERLKMGEIGYQRVVNELSWEHESKKLINFYKKILNIDQ
jgi:glycosyltransferase involved in cell wall biosynthesis